MSDGMCIFGFILGGFLIGVSAGAMIVEAEYKQLAIDKGYAEYSNIDGKFIWKEIPCMKEK